MGVEIKWIKLNPHMFNNVEINLLPDKEILFLWIQMLLDVKQSSNPDFRFYVYKKDWETSSVNKLMIKSFEKLQMVEIKGSKIVFTDFGRYAKIDRECIVNKEKMKDLRKYVLERDNYTCAYCGDKEGPFEADHVIPRVKGGGNELDNLVCACMKCNRSKGAKCLSEWIDSEGIK